jgi:bacteriocin-like protein
MVCPIASSSKGAMTMSQPAKPSSTTDNKKADPQNQADQPLTDSELQKVSGGKPSLGEIVITKNVDKSSPGIG